MTSCGFCGGPRMNGTPMKKNPDTGRWRPYSGSVNPAAENQKFACRSCAKEQMGLETDQNHEL